MFQSLGKFLGGLLIGFGLGIIISQNIGFSTFQYLAILILSLILGGFILAFSLKRSEKKTEEKTLPQPESYQERGQNDQEELPDN